MHVEQIKALERAQAVTAFTKDAVQHPRIRYGDEGEEWRAECGESCRVCGARRGQYHALGCEAERCPICDWQALSCDHDWYDATE
jgi:hypothetical protein